MKYRLIQIETNLLNANTEIMQAFADLVPSEEAKTELMELIQADYALGLKEVEILMKEPTEKRRIAQLENISLRSAGLALLHELQISEITEWRKLKAENSKHADELLLKLLLVVNALAGGLKHTG